MRRYVFASMKALLREACKTLSLEAQASPIASPVRRML
jgi:hypothetical protein